MKNDAFRGLIPSNDAFRGSGTLNISLAYSAHWAHYVWWRQPNCLNPKGGSETRIELSSMHLTPLPGQSSIYLPCKVTRGGTTEAPPADPPLTHVQQCVWAPESRFRPSRKKGANRSYQSVFSMQEPKKRAPKAHLYMVTGIFKARQSAPFAVSRFPVRHFLRLTHPGYDDGSSAGKLPQIILY